MIRVTDDFSLINSVRGIFINMISTDISLNSTKNNAWLTHQLGLAILHDSVNGTLANIWNFWVEGEKPIPCFFYCNVFFMWKDLHNHLFMFIREFFLAASGGLALDAMLLLEHLNHRRYSGLGEVHEVSHLPDGAVFIEEETVRSLKVWYQCWFYSPEIPKWYYDSDTIMPPSNFLPLKLILISWQIPFIQWQSNKYYSHIVSFTKSV